MKNNLKIEKDNCCASPQEKEEGFLKGTLYSLLPHTFCIAFILFSVIGSVAATAFFKQFLVIPYFFTFLVIISFLLATFSSFIYLKRIGLLNLSGIRKKWKYLTTLYLTMIIINVSLFTFVFPVLANIGSRDIFNEAKYNSNMSIAVAIPCSGHASLIVSELKENDGVGQVVFRMPNIFDIKYDSRDISKEKIISTEIFNTYKATIR